ncbi:hypothetical protein [Streptomyces sp. NPDC023588]|uniref:hypothetical protein n=1 Tax=Streptomyces sp. NPDC023588 TaxID=3154907 RepID=UPI0033EC6D73
MALTVLAACATACRNDTVPAWGYPELKATTTSISRALAEPCDEATPASCVDGLDRLGVLAEAAFGEVLDHELLDAGYVDATNGAARAKALRVAAARQARAHDDPHHLPFRRAVEAERRAYERLLAELRSVCSAPPPGDGLEPV